MFVVITFALGIPRTFGPFDSREDGEQHLKNAGWRKLTKEDIKNFDESFSGKVYKGFPINEWHIKTFSTSAPHLALVSEILPSEPPAFWAQ